jgi:hypothetical protein
MQTPRRPENFGIGGGHECRHLFVARLDEIDLAAGAIERAEHAVDAIARVAEEVSYTPILQALDQEIANGLGHRE